MTGQIPKYGQHFRLESLAWTPGRANRAYVLKRDPAWFIRSDKTSKAWQVYHGADRELAAPAGKVQPTLITAMNLLLDGIDYGFYQAAGGNDPGPHPLPRQRPAQGRLRASEETPWASNPR